MDFDLIQRAGLSQGQFAALLGVNRITVNTWVTGRFAPRPTLRHRVRRALAALAKAIDDGELPVRLEVPDATLARKLKEIHAQLQE